MDAALATLMQAARSAAAEGDWAAAKTAFQLALEDEETGEGHFGLGIAFFWLGEPGAAIAEWESAYVAFRRLPDPPQALSAAFYLCLAHQMSIGNEPAARGWLGRASSVVEEYGLHELRGWVLVLRAHLGIDGGRPAQAEQWAREARELALAGGDADLELCAACELGAALTEQGKTDEGMALLDEAMAGALAGEGYDPDSVVLISCRTISACSRAGDIQRATQWVRASDTFNARFGSPHLYTTCRTQYGGILFANGRWHEAELELAAALRMGRAAEPLVHAEARARLAELRLAQGRAEEAARLLVGYEDQPAATFALAAARLATGDPQGARALLSRRLRELDQPSVSAAALGELAVEAQIALGAKQESLRDARARAATSAFNPSGLVRARTLRALGRALLAVGEPETALVQLEPALAVFIRCGMPLESGRTRLLIAEALRSADLGAAVAEARACLEAFDELGAARDADAAAALLRTMGARPQRSKRVARAGVVDALTKRELEVLLLLGEGLSNREIAERLFITRKTVEHHVASVLSKTGVSGRGAAAAYAVRHLPMESAN